MIQKVVGYKVGEQFFPTIEEAQRSELEKLLDKTDMPSVSAFLINNKEMVIDILTMRPTSKPRARKINGGTKKRKPTPEAINAALQDSKQ